MTYRFSPYLRESTILRELTAMLSGQDYKASNRLVRLTDVEKIAEKIERMCPTEFDRFYNEYWEQGVEWTLDYLYGGRKENQLFRGEDYSLIKLRPIAMMSDKNLIF